MRSGTQVEAQDDEAVSRVLRIVPGPHRGQRTWVVIAMFVSSFAVAEFSARPASAQQVEGSLWETDGAVLAMVLDNNILYVGGTFSCVGPHTGAGALLDTMAGGPLAGFPRVEGGSVYAVAADGSGGWYIGGSFTSVGGVPRNCVAQVLSDNTVSAWNPNADDRVCSLAVSGNTVYAGGRFTNIGWQPRSKIAALDATR